MKRIFGMVVILGGLSLAGCVGGGYAFYATTPPPRSAILNSAASPQVPDSCGSTATGVTTAGATPGWRDAGIVLRVRGQCGWPVAGKLATADTTIETAAGAKPAQPD